MRTANTGVLLRHGRGGHRLLQRAVHGPPQQSWWRPYINPDRYDVLLYLAPDVAWVSDGQRLNGDQARREMLDERLMRLYEEFGFKDKMIVVRGDYNQRLTTRTSTWWTTCSTCRKSEGYTMGKLHRARVVAVGSQQDMLRMVRAMLDNGDWLHEE